VATTLTELEQRVQALEAAVASLRAELANGSGPRAASVPGAVRKYPSEDDPEARNAHLEAVFDKMGITGEAPSIEKLRAMLAAEGIYPGDEGIRQHIAAMRDQEEEPE
jgi:hypothetical protein